MHSSLLCLFKCFGKNIIRKAINFNIHLCSCDPVFCSGYLKIHITQVIFIPQNIRKYSIFPGFCIRDHSHCNPGNRFFYFNTCIHQCQGPCTDSSHGWRSIWLKNIGNYSYGIRVIISFRNHLFQCSVCKISMSNFPAAKSPVWPGIPGWKSRKIIMKNKFLGATKHYIIYNFFIEFGPQCYCSKRLSFSSCEQCRSVSWRKIINFAPNRSDFICLSSIKSYFGVQNHLSYCILMNIVKITIYQGFVYFFFIFILCQKIFFYFIERFWTQVFIRNMLFGNFI